MSFHEVDTIKDEPEVRLDFDWTTNIASGTVGTDDVSIQLDGISHDNVSIQYAVMFDLLNDQLQDTYVRSTSTRCASRTCAISARKK